MISKLLYRLTANRPCGLIELDSGPYLERYYLGQLFGITFYLHRFVSSDSERHLHNHPWRWGRALVLTGSYIEERAIDLCPHASDSGCVTERRRIRWWNTVNHNDFHQIHEAEPNTWTLFFHSERVMINKGMASVFKGWGFLKQEYAPLRHAITVFEPFPSTSGKGWLEAPTGDKAGRVPHAYRR